MKETIEILCHECGHERFIVIKPPHNLSEDNPYFNCAKCIREDNRKYFSTMVNLEMRKEKFNG